MADMGKLAVEPTVEAHVGIARADHEMADAGHVRTRRISLRPANRPSTEKVTDERI
jgi:hypothetical protein